MLFEYAYRIDGGEWIRYTSNIQPQYIKNYLVEKIAEKEASKGTRITEECQIDVAYRCHFYSFSVEPYMDYSIGLIPRKKRNEAK